MCLRRCRWWTIIFSSSWHRILTHAFSLSGDQNFRGVSYPQKSVGGEFCYREAGRSKGCINQLRTLVESQDGGNFLIDVALLHSLGGKKLTLGCPPPLLLMVFPCLCLLCRWWIILAWRQRLWGLPPPSLVIPTIFSSKTKLSTTSITDKDRETPSVAVVEGIPM